MEYYLTMKINMQLLQAVTVKNLEKNKKPLSTNCHSISKRFQNRLVCGDVRREEFSRGEQGDGGAGPSNAGSALCPVLGSLLKHDTFTY